MDIISTGIDAAGIGWFDIIKDVVFLIVTLVFGAQNVLQRKTLKSLKKQAAANAEQASAEAQKVWKEVDAREIENVDAIAKLWREMSLGMAEKQDGLQKEVEHLNKQVRLLKNATNRVARLLDRITPENMSEMLEEIKKEINNEAAIDSDSLIGSLRRVQDAPPNCRSPN